MSQEIRDPGEAEAAKRRRVSNALHALLDQMAEAVVERLRLQEITHSQQRERDDDRTHEE